MSLCQVPHTSLAPMLLLSYIWTSCSTLSWRISDSKYAILSCYTSLTSYTARAAPVFSVYNISSPCIIYLPQPAQSLSSLLFPEHSCPGGTCISLVTAAGPHQCAQNYCKSWSGGDRMIYVGAGSWLFRVLLWGHCEDLTWLISFLCIVLSPHFYLPHC